LVSIPIEVDYDSDIGSADEGSRLKLSAKPVAPFSLNKDWYVITRTIIPLIDQEDIFPGAGNQSGLGDIVPTLFFSPVEPSSKGVV
jgi:hypothetical protein